MNKGDWYFIKRDNEIDILEFINTDEQKDLFYFNLLYAYKYNQIVRPSQSVKEEYHKTWIPKMEKAAVSQYRYLFINKILAEEIEFYE